MDYKEALDIIHSKGNFSLPAGLERISKALSLLNNPQNDFKTIHIAGTNGKGSVSTMLSYIFEEQDLKTGLFISPYIVDFKERIQINNEYISNEDLIRLTQKVDSIGVPLTEFEFVTAIAFLYFAENNCDVAVIETGLGGRLDATNAQSKENKLVSVITKIGLDHTAVLGDTIEKIAKEKCGIIAGKVVTSPNQPKEALKVIENHAESLTIPDLKRLTIIESTPFKNIFIYKDTKYQINLGGAHQIENCTVAIEAAYLSGLIRDKNLIAPALSMVSFPARLEVLSESPPIIADGAHNPDGALALKEVIKSYGGKITAIVGMLKDKDTDTFLKTVIPLCEDVITVEIEDNPRSLKADELLYKVKPYCKNSSFAKSIEEALAKAKQSKNAVFVFGSLYLVSAFRRLFIKDDLI